MSEEEKKAIEIIKGLYIEEYEWYEDSKYCKGHSEEAVTIVEDSLKVILNLIDNQQKEIEEKNVAINKMSRDISRQLEEIEEKSTIIMAGAEKVKQLEKEIKKLKFNNHMVGKWNEYLDKDCISKDKIREKIEELREKADEDNPDEFIEIDALEKLLEENQEDGDHIPRID